MAQRIKIQIASGTNKDVTDNSTPQWVSTSNVRFWQGDLLKDRGFRSVSFGGDTILGSPRWMLNYRNPSDNKTYTLIGTHQKLYAIQGNTLTNITPLVTTTTAIANSLDTDFSTLGTDPIATTNGSKTITITHTAHGYIVNDKITIASSSAVNGIPASEINKAQTIASVPDANSYTVADTTTAATSTGSGGGASITVGSPLVTVNQTAHGFANGDRVLIAGAVDFGGVLAAEINAEHIIRDITTNTYVISLSTKATSSISAGGGAATTVRGEIADGQSDASNARGAGLGLAGAGLAGVAATSSNLVLNPRIYSGDRFGNNIVLTPGDGSAVYEWTGTITTAPTIPSTAPTDIDYVYVADNMIITLKDNVRKWSDIGESNDWTPAADSNSNSLTLRGARPFVSHAHISGNNLEFTDSQTYLSRFIPDSVFVWNTQQLSPNIGIIARNARAVFNGVVYWMGQKDFYMWAGGGIIAIPNNTIRDFVFNNLDQAQRKKIFAEVRQDYKEIRWWYPSTSGSGEIDRVIKFNTAEGHWTEEDATSISRTADADDESLFDFPRLIDVNGNLFEHEVGEDADGSAIVWSAKTNFAQIGGGTDIMKITRFIPDSTATEDTTVIYRTKFDLQDSTEATESTATITTSTKKVDIRATGRLRQIELGGSNSAAVRMGSIHEIVQRGGRR